MADADFTSDSVTNGGFGSKAPASNGASANAAEDRKIFIGGLSWETGEEQLKEYFGKFGEVESVNLKMHPVTGRSRCFAFVVFKESSSVNKVFEAGEHAINSKKVDVKRAKAKPGKIFLGGLKAELTDDAIRSHFEQFGTIIEFEMPFDKTKNQRKGFGFITFEREETMKELLKKGNVQIGDHQIDLRKATPRNDNFFKPGPYGGGGAGGYGDFYGGGMDFYGGYGDFYGGYGQGGYGGWGGYGGGKMRGRGGHNKRTAPY